MNTDPFVFNSFLGSVRKEFAKSDLNESSISRDPFLQFDEWLKASFEQGNDYANAMVLSTADDSGFPDARVMLLRNISYGGFTFYTNYESHKGQQLSHNPKASLLFFWPAMERQVRIRGTVTKLPESESDAYFASRPFESRVGAWVSLQSKTIASRDEMDAAFLTTKQKYENGEVPRPPHWGGYVLKPVEFEFWQGRTNRLHDRIRYIQHGSVEWITERLMP